MDKLEHFLKKNHHRIIYYFTGRDESLWMVMVLSIYEGVPFLLDLRDGDLQFVETGQFQKRFYVEEMAVQEFPETLREQPTDNLMRDRMLLQDSFKILIRSPMEGSLLVMGPGYMMDVGKDGSYVLSRLVDFPDSLNQHGVFQKYDLEYFNNHKNTIAQNVKTIYQKMHENFLENLDHLRREWETFSRDPSRHMAGIKGLLVQYEERTKQCEELKRLIMDMYQIWKQLSNEHDLLEIQADPISFDQNLQQNQKKQLIYRKLDRIKMIEKHATDIMIKIHIACTCLMFYMHILSCEMSTLCFRIDKTAELQEKIQKFVLTSPALSLADL